MDDQTRDGLPPEIFWGEIAPCEHLVQIYEHDEEFMRSLEGFVASGLEAGEAVILIATPGHLEEIERRLVARGLDIDGARESHGYVTLDAEDTLDLFMVEGWPEEELFNQVVGEVLRRARGEGRRVRAFGEMVALLWAQGFCGATVRLEFLWEKFCRDESFPVFCAYPKSGFTGDVVSSVNAICAAHSRVIPG